MKITTETTAEDIFLALVERWEDLIAEESDLFACVGEHYTFGECIEQDPDYDPEVDGKCWHRADERELDALASTSDQVRRMLTRSAHLMPEKVFMQAPPVVRDAAAW